MQGQDLTRQFSGFVLRLEPAHTEFAEAVELINTGAIDVKPMITRIYPIDKAVEAFALAGDRSKAMKVQLSFSQTYFSGISL